MAASASASALSGPSGQGMREGEAPGRAAAAAAGGSLISIAPTIELFMERDGQHACSHST